MRTCLYLAFLMLVTSFHYTSFPQNNDCFKGIKIEQRIIKSSFDEPRSAITINVPKEVGYGKKYKITGTWGLHNYEYNTGTYIVAAGWVDDESDTSALFWKTGYFDQRFLDNKNMDNARFFDIEMTVPKDEFAKKHKFLKMQISVSASGPNTQFLKSYGYKIPVSDVITGEVLLADVDLPSGDYLLNPLKGKNIVANYMKGSDIEVSAVLEESNCYYITTVEDEDQFNSHVRIDRIPEDGDLVSIVNRKIKAVPPGSQITTWIPFGILDQHRKVLDSLDKVTIKANILFDAVPIEISMPPYKFFDVKDLIEKYRLYEGEYNDYFIGIDNDSLRSEILTRFLIAELGANSMYPQFHDLCGETMKTAYSCFEALLFLDEIRKVADNITWIDEGITKIAKKADDLLLKNVYDAISATLAVPVDHIKRREHRSGMKLAMKMMQATVAQICNKGLLQAAWGTIKKEGYANAALVAGDAIFIPYYIKDNESYLNEGAKFYLDNYPNLPEVTDSTKYMCIGSNGSAYTRILSQEPDSYISMSKHYTDSLLPVSKDIRNSSKIADGISALMKIGEKLVAGGAIALPGVAAPLLGSAALVLQTLKLSSVAKSLIIDVGTMDQYYDWYKNLVYTSFNPSHKAPVLEDPENWVFNKTLKKKGGDITLGNGNILILKYTPKLKALSDTYKSQAEDLSAALKAGDIEVMKSRLTDLLNTDDTLSTLINTTRAAINAVYDTTAGNYAKLRLQYRNLLDLILLSGAARSNLNMSYLSKLVDPNYPNDSVLYYTSAAIPPLDELLNNINLIIDGTSKLPLKPALAIVNHRITSGKIERNQPFKVEFAIRNIGGSKLSNVKARFACDTLSTISGSQELDLGDLGQDQIKIIESSFKMTDPAAHTGYYSVELLSDEAETVEATDFYILDDKQYTTGIAGERLPNEEAISITPNPAGSLIDITIKAGLTGKVRMQLYDMLGNIQSVMYDHELPSGMYSFTLDTKQFYSGIYFLRMEMDGLIYNKRIIITQ